MEFTSLSSEERKTLVQQAIASMESDIFRICVLLNIDPSTLDPETYTYELPVVRHEYVQLKHSMESLENAKSLLASME